MGMFKRTFTAALVLGGTLGTVMGSSSDRSIYARNLEIAISRLATSRQEAGRSTQPKDRLLEILCAEGLDGRFDEPNQEALGSFINTATSTFWPMNRVDKPQDRWDDADFVDVPKASFALMCACYYSRQVETIDLILEDWEKTFTEAGGENKIYVVNNDWDTSTKGCLKEIKKRLHNSVLNSVKRTGNYAEALGYTFLALEDFEMLRRNNHRNITLDVRNKETQADILYYTIRCFLNHGYQSENKRVSWAYQMGDYLDVRNGIDERVNEAAEKARVEKAQAARRPRTPTPDRCC